MKVRHCFFLLGVLIFLLPQHAGANPCTDGVDCYCDRVQGGDLNDINLLMCEDWEAVTLHDDVNVGGGSPLFGPWYDSTGFPGARGFNSYWNRTYGPATGSCAWGSGQPASPIVGETCAFGTCFAGEWRVDNLWGANSFACMDIVRTGEFGDEVASLSDPTNAAGGGAGAFDGAQVMAHRNGAGQQAGTGSTKSWGRVFNFGVTMAIAYPTNSLSSGIWARPWKHNEWVGMREAGIFLFHNANELSENDPFQHFIFSSGDNFASCQSKVDAANVRRGNVFCDGAGNLLFQADPAFYTRSTDFPFGAWACARGEYTNFNSTNMGVKIYFQGPNDTTDRLIIDFDGFDTSGSFARFGSSGLFWNNYSNTNQNFPGDIPTNQTTYRYEDNIHITAGPPVSCAQIGFSGGDSTPPAAPANLLIQ